MKITIEPTGEFQHINGEPARVWWGFDDRGVSVVAHVRAVSPQTHDVVVNERYARELEELGSAEQGAALVLDMRNIS